MQDQMTYRKARKLNAIFLLLLLAAESASQSENGSHKPADSDLDFTGPTSEYFEQKLQEFERDKYRF